MPHFVIEHGNALNSPATRQAALQLVGEVGAGCGFIAREDIKLRIYEAVEFLHLDGTGSFLHLTVSMLAGREPEQKIALAIALRDALAERFPEVESISIDLRDMDPTPYKKRLLPARSG
ncbi:5-carboxymethyl-2-hydroxymuconate isomerase [Oceanicola sp. D3]|uniref:5-carboxymethyl-2-hydroxymuconate Delta-isomerase n=1 Tax=Oceanicola sp. D3 TaxID=2587163 RepID=UPI001121E471|nr:5-carboxymethyl-2-hydroxymuconate isomerase [Oceanicola sp. D3]QDC10036.1 5-carboxymethyl-2-hydroxymuconate isomerase [Oceanicola sp. D3]